MFLHQENKFFNVGRIMAMALVHSHNGFPFLAKSVYDYICDVPLSLIEISEEEIPNYEVKALLEKVHVHQNFIIIIILLNRFIMLRKKTF